MKIFSSIRAFRRLELYIETAWLNYLVLRTCNNVNTMVTHGYDENIPGDVSVSRYAMTPTIYSDFVGVGEGVLGGGGLAHLQDGLPSVTHLDG